jgi:hypothetical protein
MIFSKSITISSPILWIIGIRFNKEMSMAWNTLEFPVLLFYPITSTNIALSGDL